MTNLTNQQKLESLIRKAIDGGWEPERYLKDRSAITKDAKYFQYDYAVKVNLIPAIIFNHEFAKALFGYKWPEGNHIRISGPYDVVPPWEHHLKEAVISEDPIGYMYEQVFGNESN